MEESIKSLIGWFHFVGVILVLCCNNPIVISTVIICWTLIITLFMFYKFKEYKKDNK